MKKNWYTGNAIRLCVEQFSRDRKKGSKVEWARYWLSKDSPKERRKFVKYLKLSQDVNRTWRGGFRHSPMRVVDSQRNTYADIFGDSHD